MDKTFPKIIYITTGSGDMEERYINVCCKELQDSQDILRQNGRWSIFCEGCYLCDPISYCPFCGKKLGEP